VQREADALRLMWKWAEIRKLDAELDISYRIDWETGTPRIVDLVAIPGGRSEEDQRHILAWAEHRKLMHFEDGSPVVRAKGG